MKYITAKGITKRIISYRRERDYYFTLDSLFHGKVYVQAAPQTHFSAGTPDQIEMVVTTLFSEN